MNDNQSKSENHEDQLILITIIKINDNPNKYIKIMQICKQIINKYKPIIKIF